jgi:hypothetical protein
VEVGCLATVHLLSNGRPTAHYFLFTLITHNISIRLFDHKNVYNSLISNFVSASVHLCVCVVGGWCWVSLHVNSAEKSRV